MAQPLPALEKIGPYAYGSRMIAGTRKFSF